MVSGCITSIQGKVMVKRYVVIGKVRHSPVFLSSCDRFGSGCREVKCPYSMGGVNFESYLSKTSSCLNKIDGEITLKRDHQYYFQVQQQIFSTKTKFCDLVVCGFGESQTAFIHERIYPDKQHWESTLPKLGQFWRYCFLPEILGRWYTQKLNIQKQMQILTKYAFAEQSLVKKLLCVAVKAAQ